MKVVDTTFLIDLMNGVEETLTVVNAKEAVVTTQINMYELIRGFFLQKDAASALLRTFELFETLRVLPLDDNGIIKSAEISAFLVKKGEIISDADCLTAGISLSKGVSTIITRNVKHFSRIPGLDVEAY